MKRILILFLFVMGVVGLTSTPLSAQGGRITSTTLSAAMNNSQTNLTVASATGISASGSPGPIYLVYVDHEAMQVVSLSSTTLRVIRGVAGSQQTGHKSGARLYFGATGSSTQSNNGTVVTGGPFIANSPSGSCTRSANAVLPVINTNTGFFYNCNNGQWLLQTNPADTPNTPLVAACSIPIGSVAYASVGTNTTDIANKRMTTSFFVPYSFWATGLQVLQGGTATTDKITAQLADAGGIVFAPGAAAGVSLSGANTFLSVPFANAQLVTGPALYYASIVGNGTASGAYQTVATATFNNITSQGTTSITFGTFPNFTPPTTFTADLAPVTCLY